MVIPILTEDQFLATRAGSTGFVVDVASRGPCTIHRAACSAIDVATFKARVLDDRGRAGGFLFGSSLQSALAEGGADSLLCTECRPSENLP